MIKFVAFFDFVDYLKVDDFLFSQLSNHFVNENAVIGTIVGTLTTADEDNKQQYKYTILNGKSAAIFKIEGDKLMVSIILKFLSLCWKRW